MVMEDIMATEDIMDMEDMEDMDTHITANFG